jgi:hypothetical protein
MPYLCLLFPCCLGVLEAILAPGQRLSYPTGKAAQEVVPAQVRLPWPLGLQRLPGQLRALPLARRRPLGQLWP